MKSILNQAARILFFLSLLFLTQIGGQGGAFAAVEGDLELLKKAAKAAKNAEGSKLENYTLVGQDGNSFALDDFRAGKPLLISFIYTRCPDICNTLTASLPLVMEKIKNDLGNAVNALILGFDTEHDTGEAMRAYGMQHGIDFSKVRFASGDAVVMKAITERAGFYYEAEEDGSGFNHLGLVSIIDQQGIVYRQVFRTELKVEDVLEPLKELLSGNRTESAPTLLSAIKSLCLKYDPATGLYSVDYGFILGTSLQAIVVLICLWLGFRREVANVFKKLKGKS